MKKMLAISLMLLTACFGQLCAQSSTTPKVKTGIEVLQERNFDVLKGKRVGVITNPTAINAELVHIIDLLRQAPGVTVTALYGPEHGVRGDIEAGVKVANYTDEKTGIPVYSLYGATRKPTPEMLANVDVLVYDIQDIGCRSYTYISTMGLAMEAASEHNKEFVVLDRPNPLGADRIEGPMLEDGYVSFVGQFKIPYVYGMTAGELARLLNEEGLLEGKKKCALTVIPMKGYTRSMQWDETGLPWVPTSPHVPHASTSLFYVATGIMGELQTMNHGVGYTMPFELAAAPWTKSEEFAEELNGRNLPGVRFRPMSYKPFYTALNQTFLRGVQVHLTDPAKANLVQISLEILDAMMKLYPENNPITSATSARQRMFDLVNGSPYVREQLVKRTPVAEMMKKFEEEQKDFRKVRTKYLLY